MQTITHVFILCFLSFSVFSQCPEGSLWIYSQEELDQFGEQYPNCTEIDGLVNILETDVSDLTPLSNIEKISGFLNILSNDNLNSLHGLEKLTSTGTISISDMDSIQDFTTLSNLETIRGLRITNCKDLESFDGLEKVRDCSSALVIGDNPKLKNIDAIKDITKVQGFIIVNNNSLERLPNFYNLEYFGQNTGTNLITDNDNLLSLKGLDSIRDFGRFDIIRNPRLKSLDGLQGIKEQRFGIVWLDIAENDSLVTLTGLEGLDSIYAQQATHGNIYIRNNPLLENVDALGNLEYLKGDLVIENNPKLSNLDGLSKLNAVERNFIIENNSSLTSLAGLDSLDYTKFNSLTISNCENLSFCSVKSICQAITNNANITIELNNEGCNDDEEVSEICLTSNEDLITPKLILYPNPIKDFLFLENTSDYSIESIRVYNSVGALVLQPHNTDSIDFREQPNGIYFMHIRIQDEVQLYKHIKI